MRRFIPTLFLILALSTLPGPAARAAGTEPSLPTPIADLKKDGAQMKYLGRDLGFDAWLAVKDGQEQYFYVTPDGSAFFLGVLFNKNGRAITYDQIKRLQGQNDPALQDLMNAPSQKSAAAASSAAMAPLSAAAGKAEDTASAGTPSLSEQLMHDVENGARLTLGAAAAPAIYMFVDPLCSHCKEMLTRLRPALSAGKLRVEMLLVGVLAPDSYGLAKGVWASADPAGALFSLFEGTPKGLIPGDSSPDPRLEANAALLRKWKFEGTPVTVYRAKDGVIKLMEGATAEANTILKDLP